MQRQPISGAGALLVLLPLGAIGLYYSARHLTGDLGRTSYAFVWGLACGYVGPLALRVRDWIGETRVNKHALLKWGFVAAALLPLAAAPAAFLFVPSSTARVFGQGALTMFFLGYGLLPNRKPSQERNPESGNRFGFTLIEVLLVIVVIAVLAGMVGRRLASAV